LAGPAPSDYILFDISFLVKVQTLLDSVKWDDKGLAVAIAQNVDTGAILMQGFTNRDAVTTVISSRKVTLYSRSRSMLWTKGETSNNFINIHDFFFIVIVTLYVLKTS
ncbi:histidine biosynthesis bifunctional protein hisie, partial [Quercus suber]